MNGAPLPIGERQAMECLQQILIPMLAGGLVGPQGFIKGSRAVIRPDPCADGRCLGDGSRITPGSQAVDEGIVAIHADTNLERPVVVPQGRWFPHRVPAACAVTPDYCGGWRKAKISLTF